MLWHGLDGPDGSLAVAFMDGPDGPLNGLAGLGGRPGWTGWAGGLAGSLGTLGGLVPGGGMGHVDGCPAGSMGGMGYGALGRIGLAALMGPFHGGSSLGDLTVWMPLATGEPCGTSLEGIWVSNHPGWSSLAVLWQPVSTMLLVL